MKFFENKLGSTYLSALWVALIAGVFFLPTNAEAMKIQKVESPGGIVAWLVEEHSLPLVAMRFAFDGGAAQDPVGKEGVSNFLTTMLDEGAGDLKSQAFQEQMEDLSVKIGFSSSRDVFSGSFQSLSKNLDAGSELLRLALTKPRFDKEPLERMRARLAAGIVMDATDPSKVASKEWFRLAFGDHAYGRSVEGTQASIKLISADDLKKYHESVFARDTLNVSVVGDITPEALAKLLDKVFGGLPEKADLVAVDAAVPPIGPKKKVIEMKVPQAVAQFGHRAFMRKDKDFVASHVLNYIIGGGGFNSRLMEEVREKRGLAYSVYSYISPYSHGSVFLGGVATKNASIGESIDVITEVFKGISEKGPTEEELKNAKRYLTGSYPLRFDTNSKIANQLLWIQIEKLGLDYIDQRNQKIEDVSIEDIRAVAKRLLKSDGLIVTIVGQPKKTDNKG